jgi:hypothetical protein
MKVGGNDYIIFLLLDVQIYGENIVLNRLCRWVGIHLPSFTSDGSA